jgi:AraC-like DNA-binding protein
MVFKRIDPIQEASHLVECYWIIENDNPKEMRQKIVPDGFPEIIFHFADPYRINLGKGWEIQPMSLLAGQIRKYFFLENMGKASILGIKLRPTTLAFLYEIDMALLTDKVVELSIMPLRELELLVRIASSFEKRIAIANKYFGALDQKIISNPLREAISKIFKSSGMTTVKELALKSGLSERQLERQFKKHIGLSPKFYSRIIRFSSIFQLHEQGNPNWLDLTYGAGYADQSHFIRNFKAFTGDDPTAYRFGEKNMANFFLKKK